MISKFVYYENSISKDDKTKSTPFSGSITYRLSN